MATCPFLPSLEMEFTTGQKDALALLKQFEFDPHPRKCFILSGYAGTGKTTLVGHLVQLYRAKKRKVKLLAPTGRAAKVLAAYAQVPSSTIHKQIYYLNDVLEGNGLIKANNLFHDTLFIVDEASMVGADSWGKEGDLLNDVMEYVFCGQGCALLWVGDPGQLPPVGQTFSPALNPSYFEENFPNVKVFSHTLKEVVRQAEHSQIIQNATYLRTKVELSAPFFCATGVDVVRVNGMEFMEEIQKLPHFDMNCFVILTLSNKRADRWNQEIRSRLFGYEEFMERGEWIMVVKNNYHWAADREMGLMANGEMLRVKRILKEEHQYGVDFIRLVVDDFSNEEMEVLSFKETVASGLPNLPREEQKKLFFEIEKDFLHERNKKKRYQLVLKSPYFNALQIKYAYAITAHKAQGGQWEYVFIDYSFIPETMDKQGYLRWLYTCLTRAKKKVYLVNFPDEFFTNP
jgi:exodeoxyribonuclease-5